MNPYVRKLCKIAGKDSRTILGLMSGTSLDGLDIALCRISGSGPGTRLELERFTTVPYEESIKAEIHKVFAKPHVDFQFLCVLNPFIGRLHAGLINAALAEWGILPGEIDLIASHGQTVFHAPQAQHGWESYPNATLQIGDGDHIAVHTGIITLSDFRQKHIAAGGEGAPLAVYGDYLLFSSATENRILLNLGGIANFTFLPDSSRPEPVFTTDTGPGNTLMDGLAQTCLGQPFDPDGTLAASGSVNPQLLSGLLTNPFFGQPFPKSTGPEVFNASYVQAAREQTGTTDIAPADVMATLAELTAVTSTEAILKCIDGHGKNVVYVSGGGANNPHLVATIAEKLGDIPLKPMSDLGVPGDAKEAVLFAVLANEAVAAPNPAPGSPEFGIGLGKISLPG